MPEQSQDWGEPRTKTIEWWDPMVGAVAGRGLAGIDHLRKIQSGELPGAPIAAHFGFSIPVVEDGRVVFACTPDESAYNPIGVVHGGLVCTLLDSVVGCAVHTTLPVGTGYTSIEIKVSYLRAVTHESGELLAEGLVTKPGRRVAFADGTVKDAQGRLVATASSSLLVFPVPGA